MVRLFREQVDIRTKRVAEWNQDILNIKTLS